MAGTLEHNDLRVQAVIKITRRGLSDSWRGLFLYFTATLIPNCSILSKGEKRCKLCTIQIGKKRENCLLLVLTEHCKFYFAMQLTRHLVFVLHTVVVNEKIPLIRTSIQCFNSPLQHNSVDCCSGGGWV